MLTEDSGFESSDLETAASHNRCETWLTCDLRGTGCRARAVLHMAGAEETRFTTGPASLGCTKDIRQSAATAGGLKPQGNVPPGRALTVLCRQPRPLQDAGCPSLPTKDLKATSACALQVGP